MLSDRSRLFHTIWTDFKWMQVQYVPYADVEELIACIKKTFSIASLQMEANLLGSIQGLLTLEGFVSLSAPITVSGGDVKEGGLLVFLSSKAINKKSLLLDVTVHLESCFSSSALHSLVLFSDQSLPLPWWGSTWNFRTELTETHAKGGCGSQRADVQNTTQLFLLFWRLINVNVKNLVSARSQSKYNRWQLDMRISTTSSKQTKLRQDVCLYWMEGSR